MLALQPEAARHPPCSFPICTVLTRISANCDQKSQLKVPATNSQFSHLVQGMKQVLRVQQYCVAVLLRGLVVVIVAACDRTCPESAAPFLDSPCLARR